MHGHVTFSSDWPEAKASVLTLSGEYDAYDVPELVRRAEEAIDLGWGGITFDMRRVTFIDSAIIGALLTCMRRLSVSGSRMALLMDRTSAVYRTLEITALDRQFVVFETRAEAAAYLAPELA